MTRSDGEWLIVLPVFGRFWRSAYTQRQGWKKRGKRERKLIVFWRRVRTRRGRSGAPKPRKLRGRSTAFDAIAVELAEKKRREGKSRLKLKEFEWLLGFARLAFGGRPVGAISARDVLAVLKAVEAQRSRKRP
jgi:hypothetical protein